MNTITIYTAVLNEEFISESYSPLVFSNLNFNLIMEEIRKEIPRLSNPIQFELDRFLSCPTATLTLDILVTFNDMPSLQPRLSTVGFLYKTVIPITKLAKSLAQQHNVPDPAFLIALLAITGDNQAIDAIQDSIKE